MQYRPFIQRVSALTGIPESEAGLAVQAVMETLAEQASEQATHDLWSQLHPSSSPPPAESPATPRGYTADQFVEQVAAREGAPLSTAREHVAATFDTPRHAMFELQEMLRRIHDRTGLSLPEADPRPVLIALREAAPDHEIRDVLGQLPDEFKALFYEPSRS